MRKVERERERGSARTQLAQLWQVAAVCGHHHRQQRLISRIIVVYLAVKMRERSTTTTIEAKQFSLSSFPHCRKVFQKNVRNFRRKKTHKRNKPKGKANQTKLSTSFVFIFCSLHNMREERQAGEGGQACSSLWQVQAGCGRQKYFQFRDSLDSFAAKT